MHLVVFRTKYGDIYYQSEDREKIFATVLKERLDDGCWYLDAEAEKAQRALDSGSAFRFMAWRQHLEYESFEEIVPETIK